MANSQGAITEWRSFWFLPIAGALGYATSVLHIYSFGPFIEPLQAEFGWSRAQTSGGISIAAFISAIFCIPVGMLVDRVGPRMIGLTGVVLMAITVSLLATATGTHTNWLVLWGVIAMSTLWVQATVWTSAVTSRFSASRGLALAITLSGASVAATVFPVLATWLIGTQGWRMAFVGMSAIWLLLVFPFLFIFFRSAKDKSNKPEAIATEPQVLTGLSLGEGLRAPVLYKLILAGGCFAFTAIGVVVHFVPILTDSGAEPLHAASVASLVGIFSIIGRLGTGFLLDRFPAHIIGSCAFLIPLIACTLLLTDGSSAVNQAIAAAIFGLTLGSEVDVIAYLASKHFGLKNFGALYGALVMALAMGTSFGPLAAGAVFDHFGSYAAFLQLTMVLMTVSALALITLGQAPDFAEAEVQAV